MPMPNFDYWRFKDTDKHGLNWRFGSYEGRAGELVKLGSHNGDRDPWVVLESEIEWKDYR